jgi:hypothetical protein
VSGCFGEEKSVLSLPGIEPLFIVCSARNLVTTGYAIPVHPTNKVVVNNEWGR